VKESYSKKALGKL